MTLYFMGLVFRMTGITERGPVNLQYSHCTRFIRSGHWPADRHRSKWMPNRSRNRTEKFVKIWKRNRYSQKWRKTQQWWKTQQWP